jgi:hypothetical protein
MSAMRPSERLFLNRDDVYRRRSARQRAKWLYEDVNRQVNCDKEANKRATEPTAWAKPAAPSVTVCEKRSKPTSRLRPSYWWRSYRQWKASRTSPFPPRWLLPGHFRRPAELISDDEWRTVAEVAEYYPRLLAWLSEGQVGLLWNVFGAWVSVLRIIPGVRWVLWHLIFKRVAAVAQWRVALYESILRGKRSDINRALRVRPTDGAPRLLLLSEARPGPRGMLDWR